MLPQLWKDNNLLIFFCSVFNKINKLDYKLKSYYFKTNLKFELISKPKVLFNNEFENFKFVGSAYCLKGKKNYTLYYSIGNDWLIHNKKKNIRSIRFILLKQRILKHIYLIKNH